MAGDLNETQLIGRLGADPEVKSFANGGQLANMRIATSEEWKDRTTGEKNSRTEWHNVTVRGDGLIRVVQNYLKKGSRVYIRGKLQTRKWQDQSGNDRYSTEIVLAGGEAKLIMLDGKKDGGGGSGSSGGSSGGWGGNTTGAGATGQQRYGGGHTSDSGGFADDLDDSIPF